MKHNNGILLLLLIVCSLIVFCSSASIDSDLSRNQDISNAIVNAIAGSPSLMTSNKKVSSSSNNEPPQSSELTAEQANTISVIMQTMLPSMFGLFSNITTDEFKSHFQDPCRFDVLMDIFKNLPPYFDEIAKDTGQYCFGIEDTLKALESGAVEVLIVWENLDIVRYVLKIPTGEKKVLHLKPEQAKDKSLFTNKEVS
jgi:hypothetical protein